MRRLSPEGRAFLEATRGLDEPTDLDRRRLRAKTLAALATAAGAAGTLTTEAAAAGAGSALGPGGASLGWGGGAIAGALVGLAVLAGDAAIDLATGHDRRDPRLARAPPGRAWSPLRSAARRAPLPRCPRLRSRCLGLPASVVRMARGAATASRPAPGAPHAPEPTVAPEARPMAASPQPSAGPAPVGNAIDKELAALREAQEALRAGRPDEAMRVLDSFAATHASVALEEERRAARIVAACKAGGGSQARADAERFLRERPDSPLGERVRAACLQKAPP